MESSKPFDSVITKQKQGLWESQLTEDESSCFEDSFRSTSSLVSDGEEPSEDGESASTDLSEGSSSFETLFSDKSNVLYYDGRCGKLSALKSPCFDYSGFHQVNIDSTKITHGCHNSQGIEDISSGLMYSCRHTFPFKTIKSYPEVYYSNARGNHNENILPDMKNLRGNTCLSSSSLFTSKYELLKKLDEADRAIAETQKKIETLKKVLDGYPENRTSKTCIETSQSLGERIYNENKIKAEISHKCLENANKNVVDLSNLQPKEMETLKEIYKRFKLFRTHFVQRIGERRQREWKAGLAAEEFYAAQCCQWKRWVVMQENSPEWKRNNLERIQFFEKVFPKLRLDREYKEIFKSVSVRTRNQPYVRDYDLFLREKQLVNDNTKMLAANIPKLLSPIERIREAVIHENLMRNQNVSTNQELSMKVVAHWSQQEKELFKEKYVEYPKNFSVISSFFKDKSISDCIKFYYATKKEEHYKELVSLKDGRRSRGCRPERGLLKFRASEFLTSEV